MVQLLTARGIVSEPQQDEDTGKKTTFYYFNMSVNLVNQVIRGGGYMFENK